MKLSNDNKPFSNNKRRRMQGRTSRAHNGNAKNIKLTNRRRHGLILNTLMRSYSLMAQLLASSVTLMASFNSSDFRTLDLSPPNILEVVVSSFSAFEFKEDNSEMRVCTVNKALDRSENAWCMPSIKLRCSCRISCNTYNSSIKS